MENKPLVFVKFLNSRHLQTILSGYVHVSTATEMRRLEKKNGEAGQGDAFEAVLRLSGDHALFLDPLSNRLLGYQENPSLEVILKNATDFPIFCLSAIRAEDCDPYLLQHNILCVNQIIKKQIKSDFKDADTAVIIYEPEQFYDFMGRKGYCGDYVHYLNLQPNGAQKDQYQLIDFLTYNPGTEKDKQHKILSWHFQNPNGNIEKSLNLTMRNCHRILLCKDTFFSGEREFRFINTKKHITEPYNEYIGFDSKHICAMRIDEFFNGVRLVKNISPCN